MEKAVVEGAGATGLAAIVEGLVPELEGKKYALCHTLIFMGLVWFEVLAQSSVACFILFYFFKKTVCVFL